MRRASVSMLGLMPAEPAPDHRGPPDGGKRWLQAACVGRERGRHGSQRRVPGWKPLQANQ